MISQWVCWCSPILRKRKLWGHFHDGTTENLFHFCCITKRWKQLEKLSPAGSYAEPAPFYYRTELTLRYFLIGFVTKEFAESCRSIRMVPSNGRLVYVSIKRHYSVYFIRCADSPIEAQWRQQTHWACLALIQIIQGTAIHNAAILTQYAPSTQLLALINAG